MNMKKTLLKKIKRGISGFFYYIIGNIVVLFNFDKKYIQGKHFQGKFNGVFSVGWKWVVNDYFLCKKLHKNEEVLFPVSPFVKITHSENIVFDPDDLQNFQTDGTYYQAFGKIVIGKGTYIAPNVGLITANHDFNNLDEHLSPQDIILGEKCWIGMNSVILPGVELGPGTVVGAGSVVTKSFTQGNCIIAGNPARIIRSIEVGKD